MIEKKLSSLLTGVGHQIAGGSPDAIVTSAAYDSRECSPGCVFFCVPGYSVDGHDFAPEAISRGAAALVVERDVPAPPDVAVIKTPDARLAMALISAAFYGLPSSKIKLAGVTGTNGKTSVAYLIDALHRQAGIASGLIGTVENRVADVSLKVKRTTPESMDLQALLAMMADKGVKRAVMEVSSHALKLSRVAGCEFSSAIFTNLTRDHLDFHKDEEDYFESKRLLFSKHLAEGGPALLNSDDPMSARIAKTPGLKVVRYAVDDPEAEVRATGAKHAQDGISYRIESPFAAAFEVRTRLMGGFNAYNTLAMAAYGLTAGFSPEDIQAALESFKGVPGRFERVDAGGPVGVYVDYAHTPHGLENILKSAREICKGRLIAVFGCGGDRDKTKRALMGGIAAELADVVWVTNDNPRTEEPHRIIDQITLGIEQALIKLDRSRQFRYHVEQDRFAAIKRAIACAAPGDVVVIAGKGHETEQIYKDRVIHFDDREVAGNILREMDGSGVDADCEAD